MLPFLGMMLWMVPLLWPVPAGSTDPTAPTIPMSVALRYLFGVWALLILGTWRLAADPGWASGEDALWPGALMVSLNRWWRSA